MYIHKRLGGTGSLREILEQKKLDKLYCVYY